MESGLYLRVWESTFQAVGGSGKSRNLHPLVKPERCKVSGDLDGLQVWLPAVIQAHGQIRTLLLRRQGLFQSFFCFF